MTRWLKFSLLYFHAARYLKIRQVFFRGYYFVRKQFAAACLPRISEPPKTRQVKIMQPIPRHCSLDGSAFTFLNRTHYFSVRIDWNLSSYGKLWCYNLNYFDFLNQTVMEKEYGLMLIHDFIADLSARSIGLEPYPTSLRIINWTKFIAHHGITDEAIDRILYCQAIHLLHNLEYHLLGNHLLENGFALLFSAVAFPDESFIKKAEQILRVELDEQILDDGAHFELSPMYHQILLDRLLDCINLLQSNNLYLDLLVFIRNKAESMLGWLRQVTFSNGDIPLMNDAAVGIAPSSEDLFSYAASLEVYEKTTSLGHSGYRMVKRYFYELFIDIGNIGPDYIPGHAHSDTFNFVLYVHGRPLIVDTGTSTYEACERRLEERGTAAHNTVLVDGLDQSEVWGSFRVARRAYVQELQESNDMIRAWHDGYCRIGVRHTREFKFAEDAITIHDSITSSKKHDTKARIHFHPEVNVTLEGNSIVAGPVRLHFTHVNSVILGDYNYAPEFNTLVPARMVEVSFSGSLITHIVLGLA